MTNKDPETRCVESNVIKELQEILLIGFFEVSVFDVFLTAVQVEFPHITFKYLREYQQLGTGGILVFIKRLYLPF